MSRLISLFFRSSKASRFSRPSPDSPKPRPGPSIARSPRGRFEGKPYELFLTPILKGWRATRVALIGAGPALDVNLERLRRLATAGALAARQRHVARIAFVHRPLVSERIDAATRCR